jgi:uncharacterized membrane protein YedE/YeeE
MNELTRSPYVVGAGLGLLNAFAFATAGRGLGITTAFESTAALTERRLAPDALHINAYLQAREEPPAIDWESFLVAGVLAGSYLAARAANDEATSEVPAQWTKRFGPSPTKRYVAAFAGGAAMMLGARMAKGCTSGHGLTGSTQLAVSSLAFTPLMFATGILVTRLLFGKERA